VSEIDVTEYRRNILAEISDPENEDITSVYPVEKFTEYVVSILAESGAALDMVVGHVERQYGTGLIHCDAWAVDGEEGRLDIVVTDFSGLENPEPINKSKLQSTCKRALRVIDFAKKTSPSELEPSSKVSDCISLIRESLGDISQLRLHYVTDSTITSREVPEIPAPTGMDLQIQTWDIVRLNRLQSSDKEHEGIELDLMERFGTGLPCLSMPGNNAEYSGYLAVIPGNWLADLYEEFGGRLMELNVRSFLQQRGNVNKGIRETILKEPSRFLAYNNGITATVESIKTHSSGSGQEIITHIKGLQIVNGGQTVASLHRTKKIDRCNHLDQVAVQAKISMVTAALLEELVPKISRYSNTQNKVNEADFAANDSFHIEMERLSQLVWAPGQQYRWFYERARGQYQVAKNRSSTTPAGRKKFEAANPSRMKFVKTDLARYQNAWDQKPHIVGQGAQKNFVQYMTQVKREGVIPDPEFFKDMISKAIIYKKAETIARKHAFPAYRANSVAYTVALFSHKTYGRLVLRNIWDRQEISQTVEQVLTEWMPEVREHIIDTAQGKNVTEWAKKEGCWKAIMELELPIPEGLESELSEGDHLPTVGSAARQGNVTVTTEDRKNIAIVMGVSSDAWWGINKWGRNGAALDDRQCGIVMTMAGYAAGSWAKVPSVKQAWVAAGIVTELQESGVMDKIKNGDIVETTEP
jgi:hypothetical protein